MVRKIPETNETNAVRPLWNSDQPIGSIAKIVNDLSKSVSLVKLSSGMHFAGQSGYVSWTFERANFKNLELIHLTDVQLGHLFCDEKRVIEYRDWILRKPNRFILFGGDMIDAGTKISVGSPWEQMCEPQGQVYEFCRIWAPARHKVLGFVGGNHERRGVPTFGDLGSLLAYILKVPYSATQQRVDVHFGNHTPFAIRLWHGTGHSQTSGAKMMMLDRLMQRGFEDLYLTGHLHDAMIKFKWREVRDPQKLTVSMKKVGGAMSSSFLQYHHTYAEMINLEPNGLMMARVILEPNGHWELTLR